MTTEPKPDPGASFGERLRESAAHTRRTARMVFDAAPGKAIAFTIATLVGAGLPLGVAWVGKLLVDAVVRRDEPAAVRWVAAELGLVLAIAATTRVQRVLRQILGARLGIDVNVAILEKAQTLELRHFEDSEFYDKMTRARREASSRPLSLVTDAFGLVASLLGFLGFAGLLFGFSPLAVLGLLASTIPATLAEMRYSKEGFRLKKWRSPDSRKLFYMEYVLANDEHAKEVKLFGLGKLFLGRYRDLSETIYAEDARLIVRRAWVTELLSTLATLALYATYVAVAVMAVKGSITLGAMTLYVMAFRQGQGAFQSVLSSIGSMYEHNLYMSNLFSFLDQGHEPAVKLAQGRDAVASGSGLVLEDVGFRYPGKDAWVFRHVNLAIPKGEKIALVGQNGAGKTTLIKLVTRLYDPTEGRILLDGKDLRAWDHAELLARFGVVFQDFNQYQLVFRENVGVGSLPHLEDVPRIERAVDHGGAVEIVRGLKSGLDTPLGNWFREGTELSGGQWQRVALSRAFMREEAGILVLDEPTAALDAEAERAVFDRFQELSEGRTTIVISHRFPTVRMADRILVLDKGGIAEEGTHAELLEKGGIYARWFGLQAEGYL